MTATAQSFKVNVRNKNIKKSKTVEIELEVGQKNSLWFLFKYHF